MPSVATDAELVRRYLAGDQRALGDIYERYGDRVYDMCFAMLRSADDAADAYQDTFLTAANKLGQLRDTERLRSWLYSVARNQCRARLRARKRSTPVDDAGVDVATDVDMTAGLGRDELRTLMTEASAGLNEREREILELHMRHELEGEELADVLGVSVQNAYKLVQRVRDRVERSLGSLLIARHGRRDCAELDDLLASWDGEFDPLWRKRISRHIDDCSTCTRRRAGLMDPGGLAGAFPLQPVPDAAKTALQAALTPPGLPTIRRAPKASRCTSSDPETASPRLRTLVGADLSAGWPHELIDRTTQPETVAPMGTTTSTTSTPATTTPPSSTTTTTPVDGPRHHHNRRADNHHDNDHTPTTTAAPTTTTTTPPPTTTAAPTTTTTTTTTTTVRSIRGTDDQLDRPDTDRKEHSGVRTEVRWDRGRRGHGRCVRQCRRPLVSHDVVSQSGATGTNELLTDGTGVWTGSFVFPRGTIPPGSDTILEFTARAFDAAGNESAVATARPNTYLFSCD